MQPFTKAQLEPFFAETAPPCITLYQPTHRCHPENQQDPIRFRNLVRDLEKILREEYPGHQVNSLLAPFEKLARDGEFWNHRTAGLAVLAASDKFEVFELPYPVSEQLMVSERFHIKPLLKALQTLDRYQVLSIDREKVKLLEGNCHELHCVELTEVPATITAALGSELTEPHHTVASYGKGSGGRFSGHGEPSMHHGHGSKSEEVETDEERFFRVVDRAIWEHHSNPTQLPLILAALPEHQALFHEISHNPLLLKEGIPKNACSMSEKELCQAAWKILEPGYQDRLAKWEEEYQLATARGLGTSSLEQIARAALDGRVRTLLVGEDHHVPGKVIPDSGKVQYGNPEQLQGDDILDDLAELVMKTDGKVVVMPNGHLPGATGAAAILRY